MIAQTGGLGVRPLNLECEAGLDAQPCDHPTKAADGERRTTLGQEHIARLWRLVFEPA
jgi:hypothetical protein